MADEGLGTSFVDLWKQYAPEPWRSAGLVLAPAAQGAVKTAMVPGQALQSTPDNPVTTEQLVGPAADLAGLAVTGGVPFAEAGAVGAAGGRLRDPNLWHPISDRKLSMPVSEMTATHVPTGPAVAEKTITPSDLQGGLILPLWGDRSVAGSTLTHVGDVPLPNPEQMWGGHGYMERTSPQGGVWANSQTQATQLANIARRASEETGKPVYGSFTAMAPQSVDFQRKAWSPAVDLLQRADLSRKDLQAFNETMRGGELPLKDWPGARSSSLADYLAESAGKVRTKFMNKLDSPTYREAGGPDIAQLRVAITDPRLLDVPTGSGGLAISRLDPQGRTFPGEHPAFSTNMAGEYMGGFGQQVPVQTMYPDIYNAVKAIREKATGYAAPIESMMRTRTRGAPYVQRANQRWVDSVSNWLERNQ